VDVVDALRVEQASVRSPPSLEIRIEGVVSAALIDLTFVPPNLGRMRFSGKRSNSWSVVGERFTWAMGRHCWTRSASVPSLVTSSVSPTSISSSARLPSANRFVPGSFA
jgi:hypothetical protein